MTTIFHVEDDELLAGAVRSAFEAFGFPGRFLTASTVSEAEDLLAEASPTVDLVISDMSLPDGSGLDVVRAVRANPLKAHVPVLILSGHTEACMVNRAYALGANSYVAKGGRGRTTAQVVRGIYDHWLQDACLPSPTAGRTHRVIARAMAIRSRIGQRCMAIAQTLGNADGDFWMAVAQREGNLANLLMFLLRQVGHKELPGDVLDDLEAHQAEAMRVLERLEARSPISEEEALRFLLALSAPVDSQAFARAVGLLFPAAPLAMAALFDAQAASFDTLAEEIETHAPDPALRGGARALREKAATLRSATAG